MQFINYLFFILFSRLIGLIPFRLLYVISDSLAAFLNKVVKYRQDVIMKNLDFAFPNKGRDELKALLPDIYRNFTDIVLESFKSSFTSTQKIFDRYQFISNEEFVSQENVENGIVVFSAHYGNWEWATITIEKQGPFHLIGLIKPLTNKYINQFIAKNRSKTGTGLVSIYEAKDAIYKSYDRPTAIVYIADQNPGNKEKAHKIKFFGQDTFALQGGAEFAMEHPEKAIWFFNIKRLDRGRYTVTPIKIAESNHSIQSAEEITQGYFDLLEKEIVAKPCDWLWTHKRWKSQIKY